MSSDGALFPFSLAQSAELEHMQPKLQLAHRPSARMTDQISHSLWFHCKGSFAKGLVPLENREALKVWDVMQTDSM